MSLSLGQTTTDQVFRYAYDAGFFFPNFQRWFDGHLVTDSSHKIQLMLLKTYIQEWNRKLFLLYSLEFKEITSALKLLEKIQIIVLYSTLSRSKDRPRLDGRRNDAYINRCLV